MRFCEACLSASSVQAGACIVCGEPLPPVDPELFGGRYRTRRELGRGASGVVWEAEDLSVRRPVALKFLAPQYTRVPTAVRRFQREAIALASIRSDHVAQIYGLVVEGPTLFIAMELIAGRTCDEIVEEHTQNQTFIPIHRVLVILREIAQGLAAVHAAGIVHRDVKPDNVVVERGSGRTVLVDFGLAVPKVAALSRDTVGSPAYMAPEQIGAGTPVSSRTDVYALGCTAYHLLTNRLVFETDDVFEMLRAQKDDVPVPLSTHRPELAPLDRVIARALEKDPDSRFGSCTELANALEQAGRSWLHPERQDAEPPSVETALVSARILVVDDDDDFSQLAVRAAHLAFFGTSAKVARARSGAEAIANAAAKPPQLVLLDYHMPGMDGVEVLSRLRALPGAKDARVLVASARADEGARWRFDALGVDGFLRKPVELRELVDVISAMARARGWVPVEEDGLD